ncbi:MAG TPA: hypothetical protein VD969_26590 [Symbiobacteriaceae bacterium]|nr:hypothetical protein [Symbiobacteriaceae bacterium]
MSKTAPVEIGWWGQRWLTHVIGYLPDVPTEAQLKSAARAIARLRVDKGRVEAHVAPSAGAKEEVAVLKIRPLTDKEWKQLLQSLDQDRTTRLLTGQFGPELEDACKVAGMQLFSTQTTIRCTCRAPVGEGCRHRNALLLGGMTLFDSNPYLWLEVLGRARADLQAALQARLTDTQQVDDATEITADRFWETETNPDEIPVSPGDTAAPPDALLRRLGPLPVPPESGWVEMHVTKMIGRGEQAHSVLTRAARPLDEVLREYVRYIGEATRALSTGDLPPRFISEPLPGKPVALPERVLPEVEEVLRQEGALLSLEQIVPRCPTAAALPGNAGRSAVAQALAQLPPDMVTLARRYAGPRIAVLEGRAFRHVITFDEWRRGRFTADADWHRGLQAAGAEPALPTGLWESLRPEVGDELWLTVADPAGPYLRAELLHRRARLPGLDPSNVAATRALLKHLDETSQWGVTEQEAVAVLLAEGHYVRRSHQDEAWLLPFQVSGLAAERPQRSFTREARPWQPTFGRTYGSWGEKPNALRWYSVDLMNGGASKARTEMALRIINWWCQAWPGAQDRPGSLPALGALLEFLWIRTPRDAQRHGVQPELLPEVLTDWFRTLERRYPTMAGLYETHVLACGRGELYQHRLLTLPGPGAPETDTLGWIVEGYRWIGAGLCWESGTGRP